MKVRPPRCIIAALIVAAWAVPGVSTPVAAETTESCTAEANFTLTPGVGSSPSSGTFTTGGNTGTLTCKSGKGTIGFAGKYGTKDPDSCSSGGEGTATDTFTFSDGVTVSDEVEFIYGALEGGIVGGSFKGARASGQFEVAPLEGDCVSKPITKARATFKNVVIKR